MHGIFNIVVLNFVRKNKMLFSKKVSKLPI